MRSITELNPNWISTPGQTISDMLYEKRISLDEFAKQLNRTLIFVNSLIEGAEVISNDLADELENVLGAPSQFWVNRESQYREHLLVIQNSQAKKWVKSLPTTDMIKMNWIEKSEDMFQECLNFFGLRNLSEWENCQNQIIGATRFRTSEKFDSEIAAVATWLRKGEIQAESISCSEWNPKKFEGKLEEIKKLTRVKDPTKFVPLLREICSDCGIALSIVRTPKGCRASGATKFLENGKAMLLLSFRYLSDDQFWFTFFHEAAHLILHGKDQLFIEAQGSNIVTEEERDANIYAGEVLVPSYLRAALHRLRGNKKQIIGFAQMAGVSPGIVVGQMQHDGVIKHSYLNSFKRRYNWEDVISLGTNL